MQTVEDHIYLLVILGMTGTTLLAATIVLIFIRNQRRLLRHRKQLQDAALQHQKELLHASIRSQEEERRRIGRDLHDDVGTALSSLRMAIQQMVQTTIETSPAVSAGQYCKNLIDKTLDTVRNISHNLSPPGLALFGFYDTVEELFETITQSGNLQASVTLATGDLPVLEQPRALALYRVIQELLTNTIRHAQACRVTLVFHAEKDRLTIRYTDNGIGFDPGQGPAKGMGMHNIESRLGMIGARYSVITSPKKGFTMEIELNLQ
jgi:signal transduction histidine kinase